MFPAFPHVLEPSDALLGAPVHLRARSPGDDEMRRFLLGICLPMSLVTAPATPGAAQAPGAAAARGRLTPGQAATGTLATGDPVRDGHRFDVWTFQASRGDVVEVTLESEEFDPRLSLASEKIYGVIESDDDGEGRDSRIEFAVPADGEYSVTATSSESGARGRYTVRLDRPGWASGLGTRRVIRFGELLDGRLAASDPKSGGSHYQDYLYAAEEGESTSFKLTSPEFDSYLTIGRMVGDRFDELAADDDAGGGLDARIAVTFPTAGVWLVRVSTVEESRLGPYRLEAGTLMPVLTRAGSQAGQISDHDARLPDGQRYDEYHYLAEKGETVVIEVASNEFDPVVLVGEDGEAGFEVLKLSDDGTGRSARLQHTFRNPGEYFIRVSHATPSGRGRYTLRVR